jgi:hypothetical protein
MTNTSIKYDIGFPRTEMWVVEDRPTNGRTISQSLAELSDMVRLYMMEIMMGIPDGELHEKWIPI